VTGIGQVDWGSAGAGNISFDMASKSPQGRHQATYPVRTADFPLRVKSRGHISGPEFVFGYLSNQGRSSVRIVVVSVVVRINYLSIQALGVIVTGAYSVHSYVCHSIIATAI
jgi:hypothetical protein